ncbi:MAG TPA: ribonuclease J [Patescibacteria group bacterium]|nr:ribonuclease J [Patescibacteria group bacterium]
MNEIKFIPLGGSGDVTKNMYLYESETEILIVDCGIGFADETVLGVDLLLPDISYLLQTKKKIVGMILSHGHEDHIGALPFILPQLPSFPIFASPLTAAFANGKLEEFKSPIRVKTVDFDGGDVSLGGFRISFIRVTHSIPDASNLFIRTQAGNFYHGSDYKFDLTPFDKKPVDFAKIAKCATEGVLCLMSDALGAEREGHTPSERKLEESIEMEMRKCEGKFILTTYSSNISRLNQAVIAAQRTGRKICFVGRSLIRAKDIAEKLGYMSFPRNFVITADQIKNYKDRDLCLVVAGSQGQENSSMTRVANNEHRFVKLNSGDVVVFSADPIPGNEISINAVIDAISRTGARVVYSEISDSFHVSGHGSSQETLLLMALTNPRSTVPIGGTYRQMVAYKNLAKLHGLLEEDIFLPEDGQEVVFLNGKGKLGRKIQLKTVYVDEISGAEVEQFVLRDRQKIAQEGVVIVMIEVDASTGQIVENPNIIARGFSSDEARILSRNLSQELKKEFQQRKGAVKDWIRIRKITGKISEAYIYKNFKKHPLVLPVVVEV